MKPKATLRPFLAAIGCAALTAPSAHAAELYWEGTGAWDTTSTVWGTDSGGPYDTESWANANNDTAVFEGASDAVTLTEAITVGGLRFDTAGYTITGNTLTFGAAGNIAANADATISSVLAGSAAITKTGSGILTLSGANTFSGQLTVANGTLSIGTINQASADGTLGNSASAVNLGSIGNTGTLRYTGGNAASNKTFTLATGGTGAFEVATGGQTLTLNGVIGGGGGLRKDGAGILSLTNNSNSFSGGITINGGEIRISSDSQLGATSNGITFANTGRLLTSVNNVTIAATRTITVDSGAIAVLGDTNVNSNPLTVTFAGQITGDGSVQYGHYQLGSGVANFTNTNNNFAGAFILGRSSAYESFTYSGITANVASLADGVGNGNIIFGRGNNASANTATFAWSNSAVSALVLNNRRIELDTAVETAVLANNNTNTSRTVTVNTDLLVSRAGNKTFGLGGSNTGDNTFAGLIADGTGAVISLAKSGTGTWIVSNDNSYTGTTSISGGTLSVGTIGNVNGGNSPLGNPNSEASGRILIGSATVTGTLRYTGAASSTDRTIQINSTNNGNNGGAIITNNGSGALTFTATTFNQAYINTNTVTRGLTLNGTNGGAVEGTIQDNSATNNVSVTIQGSGIWELAGANTYTGATNINTGGTYRASGSNSSSAVTTVGSGTLQLNSNSNGGLASGAINLNNAASVVQALNTDRTITNDGIINANPTFSGDYSIAMGNLRVNNGNRTITNDILDGKSLTVASIDRDGTNNRNLIHEGTGTTIVEGAIALGTGTIAINGGTLLINGTTSTGEITVGTGGTLGGIGTIAGATTVNGLLTPGTSAGLLTFDSSLALGLGAETIMEIGGTGRGVAGGYDAVNVGTSLAYGGILTLDFGDTFGGGNHIFNLFDFGSQSDDFNAVQLDGAYTGAFAKDEFGVWTTTTNGGNESWTFTQSTGNLNLLVIPEPSVALLGGLGMLLFLRRRR